MSLTTLALMSTAASMVVSNFLWQLVTTHNWDVAMERSFFQTVALVCAGFALRSINA